MDEKENSNYVHLIEMGADIIDAEKKLLKFRIYPSDMFLTYAEFMQPDTLAIILGVLAQIVIDKREEKNQIKFVKSFLRHFKKNLDETMIYDIHKINPED
jgi:hypothetical protein